MWAKGLTVVLAADHAGFALKEVLKGWLAQAGVAVEDCGAVSPDPADDYPCFIFPAARRVQELRVQGAQAFGVVLGGSGQGEAMAANKVPGVRAAVFYGGDLAIARLAREHNDAFILSLGARFVGEEEAKEAVRLFLTTPFSREARHARRLEQIAQEECR
ncbi:RpiB/LacA/LacB family sugar-phosphate isomerase [Candidatus Parcubacteria bacterium]|nr:MAG: RpiB/LacA/LacB family sugar-phosphate isomerase [Candidatus Parcubacteria bacterium]GIW68659.1 MAG: ribose-5-phosphate isomerase [Candidatus Parcubacteria bacterium]